MKKLLVVLTLMVGVLGFSTGAFSAWGDPICTSCGGTAIRNVPCNIPGVQADDYCLAFDYDLNEYFTDYNDGYCNEFKQWYRAIFNICNCEDRSAFKDGSTIGLRMTILVDDGTGENGAYWSENESAPVPFGAFANTSTTAGVGACDPDALQPFTFGATSYYRHGSTTAITTPLTVDPVCEVVEEDRATILAGDGYQLDNTADNIIDGQLSHWWIDIPPIRIDPYVLHNGEKISVRIELLGSGIGGLCAECEVICSCVVDVAYACCETTYSDKLLFPYFTSLGDDAYWNGIVIDNLSSADGTATLTAYEKDGSVGTFTTPVIPAHSMFVDLLENIAWSGDGLGNAPCYIIVTTDFDADGFAMMADETTHDSMGYLPRSGCW